MKRILAFWAMLLLISGGIAHAESAFTTIAVSSDLHFGEEADSYDAILDAVVGQPADALLLLGDLTNNGKPDEHRALVQRLQAAKEKGATIYVLPGNHDMNVNTGSVEQFATLYQEFGYNAAFSRDPASLSYAVQLTDTLWVAMLDTCQYGEVQGIFRAETEQWLTGILAQARRKGAQILVAGHYPMLQHTYNEAKRSDQSLNGERLTALLRAWQVPLYLAGHRHNAHYATVDNLTEIVIGKPTDWPNKIGWLEVSSNRIDYATKKLDVAPGFAESSFQAAQEKARHAAELALQDTPYAGDADMLDFFVKVNCAIRDNTLYAIREECLSMPAFTQWQDECIHTIYRPWLRYMLENMTEDYNVWHWTRLQEQ